MCGRLATLNPDEISAKCEYMSSKEKLEKPEWIHNDQEYKPVFNGPPTTVVAVLSSNKNLKLDKTSSTEFCLIPMRWGMLPSFKTEATGNFHTHNARIENILKSNLYKPSLMSGKRCVIITEGYYEWQTTPGENLKQPFFLYQNPDGPKFESKKNLIKLAGLFNISKDGDSVKYSCTVLTREADSSMAWMHYRMPVILNTREEVNNWLNYEEIEYKEAIDRLPKYEDCKKEFRLKHHAVNKTFVNNSSCNEAKCMQPAAAKYAYLSTLHDTNIQVGYTYSCLQPFHFRPIS
ncbi:PREDICTED: embryonic stem cell-specific 5-hydroxymethylcytosine-binding protein isoform X2 [Nicrophorus vespilloides]|uniref:Abasic site processing protein HMCES n=1 Tax=Nicrophorus vespilloides TaxID=110193 RepID=A0ABM1M0D7_NICVS|nr:PREDICTED: embryonic stem cell-specific 5-hydroxymethylcytosine-binding protein isoform X2 [Nicrophorus vespilloides]